MSSRFLSVLCAALVPLCASPAEQTEPRELRVCADPDNLPYSHADGSGFENHIAQLVAEEMHATLRHEWLPLRRGFVRRTLGEGRCDLLIGVPAEFQHVMTTRPYYRSSFAFVYRHDDPVRSFDDSALAKRRIGVQLIGNDLAATPPGHALARRGAITNVEGFTVYGEGPAAQRMVDAIATHKLDAGLIWGPQAGFFAHRAALEVSIALPPADPASPPFEFAIAMGVRRGDRALRDELDAILERRRAAIDAILHAYHVLRTDRPQP
jgi:quinoprotein dehydrogenase-associated probable ABC transporter substrate-binding protein